MANTYTFYPTFSEYVTLYRGIVRTWMGDGTQSGDTPGQKGVLYAQYVNSMTQEIGPISSYAIAVAEGFQGDEDDWVAYIANITTNAATIEAWAEQANTDTTTCVNSALKSEGYAVGEQNGTPVSSGTYYENNAKYYSQNASSSATSAENNGLKAEGYAIGKQNGSAVVSGEYFNNNAKYYSDKASTDATSSGTNALVSEGYAVGKQNGTSVVSGDYYQNNAKYYKEQAALSASDASASELQCKYYYDNITPIASAKADKANTVLTSTLSRGRKQNSAIGTGSVAFGNDVEASGSYSHAEGVETIANHKSQNVFGEYNVSDSSVATAENKGDYAEIVGNGTGTSDRSNARTLDWNGNERLKGDLYVGCNADSSGGVKVTTTSKVAAASGTDLSLVTTGEKHTWNSKISTEDANDLVESVEQEIMENIYPFYDPTHVYLEGERCSYQAVIEGEDWEDEPYIPTWIYKHKSWNEDTPVAEDFDIDHWDIVTVDDDLKSLEQRTTNLENKIVYSANEPLNPFLGMIWLKPVV